MKKLQLLAILTLSLFLVLSCTINDDDDFVDTYSGDDTDTSSDTLPDNQQDSDTDADTNADTGTTDTDSDTDNGTTDTDTADSGVVDTDTVSDTDTNTDTDTNADTDTNTDTETDTDSDTDADTSTDTGADTGDTDTNTDTDTDTGSEQPDELPECSSADVTPCKESVYQNIWSKKSGAINFSAAESYCNQLNEGGYQWRMPEIYELRTLIQNCSSTAAGGPCNVTKDCSVSIDECNVGCSSCNPSGAYSKFGDSDMLWSYTDYTVPPVYYVWTINFSHANLSYGSKTNTNDKYKVRCIKK